MMNEGALIISVLGLILVPLTSYILLKGTIFDVSSPKNNPWPLLWYYELALVLIPLVIVSAVGIDHVPIFFKAVPGTEGEIAVLVIITLVMYVVALSFSLRLLGLYKKRTKPMEAPMFSPSNKKLLYSLCFVGILLVVSFYFLGYRHAFLTSILEGKRLLEVRLANRYFSHVPSQVQSILPLLGYLIAALAGYQGRVNLKKSLVCLMVALFILTMQGSKAPPAWGLIIWILAKGSLVPKRLFSLKSLLYFSLIACFIIGILYYIVSLHIPELTFEKYVFYLTNRLGIGQMAGVYETFGLWKTGLFPEGNFYWHMFPGARFFANYMDFQKVLMMVTEGHGYSEMGVKNSYFIAEAFAIGGFPLVFLSPIIVAFSTALGLTILNDFVKRIIGKGLCWPITMLLYLKTQSITGGFSHFPIQKGLILMIGQLFIIWLLYKIIMFFLNIKLKISLYNAQNVNLEHKR